VGDQGAPPNLARPTGEPDAKSQLGLRTCVRYEGARDPGLNPIAGTAHWR
jgi:hypothetical protein